MLYIVTTDGHTIEWHVGEAVPEIWGRDKNEDLGLQRISYLQADSTELEHIKRLFKNSTGPDCVQSTYTIPMVKDKRTMKWYGDIARTIYLNL